MSAVRGWTAAICMAALAATVLQGIVPNGAMERMLRLVIGAFVICVLILPLRNFIPQILWSLRNTSAQQQNVDLKGTVENQMQQATQESIRNLVVTELNSLGIKSEKVTTFMDIGKDNSIVINRVEVVLAQGYDSDCTRAAAHLKKTLGLKMEVTAYGGE